jgi:hypothetical protein
MLSTLLSLVLLTTDVVCPSANLKPEPEPPGKWILTVLVSVKQEGYLSYDLYEQLTYKECLENKDRLERRMAESKRIGLRFMVGCFDASDNKASKASKESK